MTLHSGWVTLKEGILFWNKKWMMMDDDIMSFRKSEVSFLLLRRLTSTRACPPWILRLDHHPAD